jgi:hypothetical protein
MIRNILDLNKNIYKSLNEISIGEDDVLNFMGEISNDVVFKEKLLYYIEKGSSVLDLQKKKETTDRKKEYHKLYYTKNKEKLIEYQKNLNKSVELSEEEILQRKNKNKKYYLENKERIRQYQQKYNEENKEKFKQYYRDKLK